MINQEALADAKRLVRGLQGLQALLDAIDQVGLGEQRVAELNAQAASVQEQIAAARGELSQVSQAAAAVKAEAAERVAKAEAEADQKLATARAEADELLAEAQRNAKAHKAEVEAACDKAVKDTTDTLARLSEATQAELAPLRAEAERLAAGIAAIKGSAA